MCILDCRLIILLFYSSLPVYKGDIIVNDNAKNLCHILKYDSLVLEGGGLKGLAYVGAMKALANYGYYANDVWQFKNISGTSIGCLFGYFIALDISPSNLETIALTANFSELFHQNVREILNMPSKPKNDEFFAKFKYFWKLLHYIRGLIKLWFTNDAPGISDGREIMKWLMLSVLKYSPYKHLITSETTFSEFQDITQHTLTCYTAKITHETASLMELNVYTAPKQRVLNVLYSSMTLPIIFKPLADINDATLVDGGLILNFPIYQQDWDGIKNERVLGLSLHQQPTNQHKFLESQSFNFNTNINKYSSLNTIKYVQKLISIITSLNSYILYSDDPRNCDRIIYLNSINIKTLEIDLTNKLIQSTIDTAYKQVKTFMKSQNCSIIYEGESNKHKTMRQKEYLIN